MLTYYVTLLLVAYFSDKAQRYRQLETGDGQFAMNADTSMSSHYLYMAAAVLIIVSGLRMGVGADFFAYSHAFYERKYVFFPCLLQFKDPGFALISSISRTIYNEYAVLFTLSALITIGLIFCIINKFSEDLLFSSLLYIFIGSWHGSFNAVRQYLAMAVIFYGHRYIFERNFKKYLLTVFIAMTFHKTALIMLPIYFIVNSKNAKQFWIFLGGFGLALFVSYDLLFDIMTEIKGKEQEVTDYSLRAVNIFRTLVAWAPLIFPYYAQKDFFQNKENDFYLKMLYVNAVFMLSTSQSAYLARVGIYTDIYALIAFPKLIKVFPVQKRHNIKLGILFLYAIFWYIEVTGRWTLTPFRWIFQR